MLITFSKYIMLGPAVPFSVPRAARGWGCAERCSFLSMNTTVTAQNMSVKAVSDGGLAIASYDDTGEPPVSTAFASSANAEFLSHGELYPTSFNGTSWYKATANNINSYAATNETALANTDDPNDYYLLSKFQVKSLDEGTNGEGNGIDLYIRSIVIGGETNSSTLNKSLRVVVKVGNTYYYFAPMYTSSTTLYYWNGSSRTAYSSGGINLNTNSNSYSVKVLDGTLNTTPQDVLIYTYYEGEDENCASVYAMNIDTLTVTVTFSTQSGT